MVTLSRLLPSSFSSGLSGEIYRFIILSSLAGGMYGAYYGVFLYQQSMDLRILLIDSLVSGLSGWFGFLLGTYWLRARGYARTMRLAFLLWAVMAGLTALLMGQIQELYVLFSVIKGIPTGIAGAVMGLFLLKELGAHERTAFFYRRHSWDLAAGIMLPLLVGAVVTYLGGFKSAFIAASVIYFLGALLPHRADRHPRAELSLSGMSALAKEPNFKRYALQKTLLSGADTLNGFLFAIVPYLIIKSVFGVGLLSSGIAVAALLTTLAAGRLGPARQIYYGYIGTFARLGANLILVFFWSTPALVLRGLFVQVVSSLTDPVSSRLGMNNLRKISPHHLGRTALELDLMDATLSLIGHSVALGLFLLVLSFASGTQLLAVKVLLVAYAVWKIFLFVWMQHLYGPARAPEAAAGEAPLAPAKA